MDKYKPSGDYVVIKFARWAFEKFKGSVDKLGTQMRAVGEVMSIGKTTRKHYKKQSAVWKSDGMVWGFAKDFHEKTLDELYALVGTATSERQFILYEAIRKGADLNRLFELTKIKKYFLEQMKELVDLEEKAYPIGARSCRMIC